MFKVLDFISTIPIRIIMKVLNKLAAHWVIQTIHDDVHQNFIFSNRMIVILRLEAAPTGI